MGLIAKTARRIRSERNKLLRTIRSPLVRYLYRLRGGWQAEAGLVAAHAVTTVHSSSFAAAAQLQLLYVLNRHDELSDLAWKVVLGPPKYRRNQTTLHILLKSAWILQDQALLEVIVEILKSTTMTPNNLAFMAMRRGAFPGFAYTISQRASSARNQLIGLLPATPMTVGKIVAHIQVLDLTESFDLPDQTLDALRLIEGQAAVSRYLGRIAMRQERWMEAWDQLEKSRIAYPNDQRTYVDLGEVALYLPDALERIDQTIAARATAGVVVQGYDKLSANKYLVEAKYRKYVELRDAQVSNLAARQTYGSRARNSIGLSASKYEKSERTAFVIGRDGVSDELRWAYYYNELFRFYSKVGISCDPRLENLFKRSFPNADIFPVSRNWGRAQTRAHDIPRDLVPNMELAARLDNRAYAASAKADEVMFIEDVALRDWKTRGIDAPPIEGEPPGATILPDPERAAYWKDRLDQEAQGRLKIGLIWRSGLVDVDRARHYMQLEDFDALRTPDIALYSIQHEVTDSERATGESMGVTFVDDEVDFYNDFDEIAAMVSGLDLVLGVSTLPYEVAAAVGIESWICAISPFGRWYRLGGDGTGHDRLTRNGRVFHPAEDVGYLADRPARVSSIMMQMLATLRDRGQI